MNRICTLVFLAVALLVVSPGTTWAQSEAKATTMAGLKFDSHGMKANLDTRLRDGIKEVFGEIPLTLVDFKDVSRAIDPVTQDCFTADCLQKIGPKVGAPLGLSVEIDGENEIYAWTFTTWDLKAGRKIHSTQDTCELCGDRELAQAFSASLKEMLENGPPAGGEEPFELEPGQVLMQVNVLPEQADIYFDGELVGQGYVVLAVDTGEHELQIRMDGYRDIQERILMNEDTTGPVLFRYHLTSTNPAVVEVPPTVGPIDRLGADTRFTLGLVGVGVGVVALGTGIYLTAIDGEVACDAGVPAATCPDVYATAGGGMVMGVLGTALLTGGVTLLSWELLAGSSELEENLDPDAPETDAAPAGPSVSVSPAVGSNGGGLVFRGSF
ncbi:PEGA domain-containing protein [Bradymonas sediminis]|nr:PEGA domain-containing protein [Bradymonas sediminis]TDP73895.1 PEGA domain-containing protein [Bradymonas sediminis]